MTAPQIDIDAGTFLRKLDERLANLESGAVGLPSGTQMVYAGRIDTNADNDPFPPPLGWYKCTGEAISRNSNAELFKAIGTRYGTGDGSTTFNLPFSQASYMPTYFSGVYLIGGTTIGTLTNVTINFDGEIEDQYNMHDGVTNTSRIYIPSDGVYNVGLWMMFATSSTGFRQASIKRTSGVTTYDIVQANDTIPTGAPRFTHLNPTATIPFLAGDYVTVVVDNLTPVTNTIYANFWVARHKPETTLTSVIIKR